MLIILRKQFTINNDTQGISLLLKISTDIDCMVTSGDFNIPIDNHTDAHAREPISLLEAFGPSFGACNRAHP